MNLSSLTINIGIGLVAVYLVRALLNLLNGRRPPLPPGPKGLPLIGNLNDLPKPGVFEAHHWLKHKELYGPLSSITVLGRTMVIINDAQLAYELLNNRSAKYSSRPKLVFAGDIIGWSNSMALIPYGSIFRAFRKKMTQAIGTKTEVTQFNKIQEAEVGHLLLQLLENPESFSRHIRREAGAVILKITYGYTVESHRNDPLVDLIEGAVDKFNIAARPGAFWVDIFPFLKRLPDWLPGMGFKNLGRQWAAEFSDAIEKPYNFVKHQMAQGNNEKSFVSQFLEAGDSDPEERFANKWSSGSLYAAGADTTVALVEGFFLAMTIYPEVQRKAQEEIDRVVGQDRLPTFADREHLPYIEAIVKEVLRWTSITPLILPHTSTQDDICEGYFIPKGSMLLANVWHFTHDPSVYHDPMTFKPERFLDIDGHEPELNPDMFVFGFGRRLCPGRFLADNSLYLNISQSLAVFNISKCLVDGREVSPPAKFQPGAVSHPMPFKNVIKPRSPHHEMLIRSIEDIYPWQEGDSKLLESMA